MSRLRNGADTAFGILALITVVLAAVQIGLAGLGACGGFRPHLTHGYVVALFTVLMLVAALIAGPARSVVTRTVVLFVLAVPHSPCSRPSARATAVGSARSMRSTG